MRKSGKISVALLLGALPAIAGCTTDGTRGRLHTVTVNSGSYQTADTKIGNDIKSILSQGGVDISNQTAPSAKPTVAQDRPKTLSTTATDLQTLVAQLDNQTGLPKQNLETAPINAATTLQPTPKADASALALTEEPKTNVIENVQTSTFPTIGNPVGDLSTPVPYLTQPEVKTVRHKATVKTKRRVAQQSDRSSYKAPTVERF
jgi:hypothetical protein